MVLAHLLQTREELKSYIHHKNQLFGLCTYSRQSSIARGWNLKWSCRIYVYSSFVGLYKSSQYHTIWSFFVSSKETSYNTSSVFCYCTNSNHNFTHYYYKQKIVKKKPRRNLLSFFITSLRYRVLKLVHLRVL